MADLKNRPKCVNCGCGLFQGPVRKVWRHFATNVKSHNAACRCRDALFMDVSGIAKSAKPSLHQGAPAYKEISVELVDFSPANPRKGMRYIQELADNITENGLINPITVQPVEGGRYKITTGERRFRAVQLLKWPAVPCWVKNSTDFESLAENLVRDNMSIVEWVPAVVRLLVSRFGDSWMSLVYSCYEGARPLSRTVEMRKCLAAIGVNPHTLAQYLPVLRFPAQMVANILENRDYYTDGVIRKLAALKDESAQLRITRSIADRKFANTTEIFRAINQASWAASGASEEDSKWLVWEESLESSIRSVAASLRKLKVSDPPVGVLHNIGVRLHRLGEEIDFARSQILALQKAAEKAKEAEEELPKTLDGLKFLPKP